MVTRSILFFLFLAFLTTRSVMAEQREFELTDGDRVVFLGDAYIQRMQEFGYVEALLTSSYLDCNVSFRNLGRNDFTISANPQEGRDSQQQRMVRLVKEVGNTKPTVIILHCGVTEALAGRAGLPRFNTDLEQFLDELTMLKARIVLIVPFDRDPGNPKPDGKNADLRLYRRAIADIAAKRKLTAVDGYVDLRFFPMTKLTSDGKQQLSELGHWVTAGPLAWKLGAPLPKPGDLLRKGDLVFPFWQLLIKEGKVAQSDGTRITEFEATVKGYRFVALDRMLPMPNWFSTENGGLGIGEFDHDLKGQFPAGTYEIQIDGVKRASFSHEEFKFGVSFTNDAGIQRWQSLRRRIVEKSELCSRRNRLQHGADRLVVEEKAARFAELISEKEATIAELRKPKPQSFAIIRVKEGS